jgi:lactoylglutathione lyase
VLHPVARPRARLWQGTFCTISSRAVCEDPGSLGFDLDNAVVYQSKMPVLDHIAIYVTDLKKSSAFYRDVLGLDSVPEPFRDGKHAWFAIGQGKQLHIIEGATSRTDQPKRNHTCFRIASLQDFITRLTKAGIAYEDLQGTPGAITLRPDGIQQIYFRDPDGYWIEMNDAGKQ